MPSLLCALPFGVFPGQRIFQKIRQQTFFSTNMVRPYCVGLRLCFVTALSSDYGGCRRYRRLFIYISENYRSHSELFNVTQCLLYVGPASQTMGQQWSPFVVCDLL